MKFETLTFEEANETTGGNGRVAIKLIEYIFSSTETGDGTCNNGLCDNPDTADGGHSNDNLGGSTADDGHSDDNLGGGSGTAGGGGDQYGGHGGGRGYGGTHGR